LPTHIEAQSLSSLQRHQIFGILSYKLDCNKWIDMLSVSLIPPELPNLFPYKLIIINQQWNLLFASSGRKTMKSNTKFWERDQNGNREMGTWKCRSSTSSICPSAQALTTARISLSYLVALSCQTQDICSVSQIFLHC